MSDSEEDTSSVNEMIEKTIRVKKREDKKRKHRV